MPQHLSTLHVVKSHPLDYFAAVILDISMPIVDGYDAIVNIYNYLNWLQNIPNTDKPVKRHWSMRRSRTLIFSLSAETSTQTEEAVRSHPFDGILPSLNQEEI